MQEVIQMVQELDPALSEDDDVFRAAVIMVMPAQPSVGFNFRNIVNITGYPHDFVRKVYDNFWEQGIFRGPRRGTTKKRHIAHGGWDKPGGKGTLAFWMDAMCGTGQLVRDSQVQKSSEGSGIDEE